MRLGGKNIKQMRFEAEMGLFCLRAEIFSAGLCSLLSAPFLNCIAWIIFVLRPSWGGGKFAAGMVLSFLCKFFIKNFLKIIYGAAYLMYNINNISAGILL